VSAQRQDVPFALCRALGHAWGLPTGEKNGHYWDVQVACERCPKIAYLNWSRVGRQTRPRTYNRVKEYEMPGTAGQSGLVKEWARTQIIEELGFR
jgi:hypothetical protein